MGPTTNTKPDALQAGALLPLEGAANRFLERTGVRPSRTTIREWILTGEIGFVRLGRRYYIAEREIDAYITRKSVAARASR